METTQNNELENLKAQVKFLKGTVGAVIAVIILFFIFSFQSTPDNNKKFKELTVEKLNIASPEGTKRMILTHKIGAAPFNGKKLERNVPPTMAGMIYLNPNGDEIGGVGWAGNESRTFALNALDYTGTPMEAIGFNRIQNEDTQSAQLVVMDNPRRDIEIDKDKLVEEINSQNYGEALKKLQKQMVNRVTLGVENHNASLLMSDKSGNPRIKLMVDDNGKAKISVLDEEGNEVASLPN